MLLLSPKNYRLLDMENYAVSLINLYKPYSLFDLNVVVVSSQSTLFEGDWANYKLAEHVPVDYTL